MRIWPARLLFVVISIQTALLLNTSVCRGEIMVSFDKDLYVVDGPGEQITIKILIDGDAMRDGFQPVPDGLFSAGVKMTFNNVKASVAALADVAIAPEIDFFGFNNSALVSVNPGEVAFHGNVDQFNAPPIPYSGALLATVTLTNLASAVDSYPLQLDFSRDLGVNEDFFVDGSGTTLDSMITFVPSQVTVVPEPSAAILGLVPAFWLLSRFFFVKFTFFRPLREFHLRRFHHGIVVRDTT